MESLDELESSVRQQAMAALEIREASSRAWTTLAFIEWAKLRPASGLEHALRAIRYGPEDPLAYYSLNSLLMLYANALALQVVQQSTQVNPLYSWGYIGEACSLFQQGHIDEAVARLDRALELEPESYAANSYRCIFLSTAGRLPPAYEAFSNVEDRVDATPSYLREYAKFALDLSTAAPANRAAIMRRFADQRCRSFECVDEAYRFLIPLLLRYSEVDASVAILDEYADFGIMPAYDWVMLNPRLSQLRDHPRFAAIEMGSRAQYRQAHGLIEAAPSGRGVRLRGSTGRSSG